MDGKYWRMRVFLKNIRPNSYFGELVKGSPNLDPHGDAFKSRLLGDFEKDLLVDGEAWKKISGNILSHISKKNGGYALSGLNLYEPEDADMDVMIAAYEASSPYWLIPARVYKAVVSRDLAKRNGRMSRGVSRRTLEDCAERIMWNVGALLVNEDMMEGDIADDVCDFKKMFPVIRRTFCEETGPEIAKEIRKNGEFSQSVGFAFWWYYMV